MNQNKFLLIIVSMILVGCATNKSKNDSFDRFISNPPIHLNTDITYFKNIAYDTSQLTVFDMIVPENTKSVPLVIFIHGGGFTGGDKSDVYTQGRFSDEIEALTAKGIAFVTINYRLLGARDVSNIMGCLNDSKRCLQFIKYHAKDLNIDESRIGLYGGSAGAGTSLWLGMSGDMSNSTSTDPIERKSTRVKAVAAYASQSTYDLEKWDDVFHEFGMTDADVSNILGTQKIARFYGVSSKGDLETKEIAAMRKNIDLLELITSDDPPLWIHSPNKTSDKPKDMNQLFHHYRHGEALYIKSNSSEIDSYAKMPAKPFQSDNWIELVPFFIKYL